MSEILTIRQILAREGKCVVVLDGNCPVKAYATYPPAKAEADRLTKETGSRHEATLWMDFSRCTPPSS